MEWMSIWSVWCKCLHQENFFHKIKIRVPWLSYGHLYTNTIIFVCTTLLCVTVTICIIYNWGGWHYTEPWTNGLVGGEEEAASVQPAGNPRFLFPSAAATAVCLTVASQRFPVEAVLDSTFLASKIVLNSNIRQYYFSFRDSFRFQRMFLCNRITVYYL